MNYFRKGDMVAFRNNVSMPVSSSRYALVILEGTQGEIINDTDELPLVKINSVPFAAQVEPVDLANYDAAERCFRRAKAGQMIASQGKDWVITEVTFLERKLLSIKVEDEDGNIRMLLRRDLAREDWVYTHQ